MRLHAKRRATHLTWTGTGLVAVGIALGAPEIVTFGAALVTGVALSRALTSISIARARAAGFEMLWRTGERTRRANRLVPLTLLAELRNRDSLPTQYQGMSAMHSPHLRVEVSPQAGEIPPGASVLIELLVTPLRVGHHGIHGLTLETIRAPGLFSVPLSFSNPFVLEVLPRTVALSAMGAGGQSSRQQAPEGGGGRLRGDGPEFRELREHRPGDPFRGIAWKASAKRGRLLVVDKEQQQRDVVWLFIDASAEAFAGPPGQAGIDQSVDAAIRVAEGHLARGDVVGLEIVGPRHDARVHLGRGPRHAAELISTLAFETHAVHSDRSEWDATDVLQRVLEHARTLDPRAAELNAEDVPSLEALARQLVAKAPVTASEPLGDDLRDALMRRYLLSFGIHAPPKASPDRHATQLQLANLIREMLATRPRPGLLYLFAKVPSFETPRELLDALAACKKSRVTVRFVPQVDALPTLPEGARDAARLAHDALHERLELATTKGTQRLTLLGVEVVTIQRRMRYLRRKTTARSMSS